MASRGRQPRRTRKDFLGLRGTGRYGSVLERASIRHRTEPRGQLRPLTVLRFRQNFEVQALRGTDVFGQLSMKQPCELHACAGATTDRYGHPFRFRISGLQQESPGTE